MNILVSAYACEPDKGSEPGVGWNWVMQASRFHDVWVLTRSNNRPAIERALQRTPRRNVRWVYVDLPPLLRWWKRGSRGIHLYYYLWQIAAYFAARRLDRHVGFDVVHHVTFVSYWKPTLLPLLGKPIVWGPVGGGESAPRSFLRTMTMRGRCFEHLRNAARAVGERDPFVRGAARHARAVLVTTNETGDRVSALGATDVRVLSQVALCEADIARLADVEVRHEGPFRIVSVGRLVEWKGFHLALDAFAEMRKQLPSSEYWLIGDGPARPRLEDTVRRLRLDTSVRFLGSVPRATTFARLAECDVLVHPSLHESGGWVCAEAMAAGRPVICLALGGPALHVTPDIGYAVAATSPGAATADMASAMLVLARDPLLRARMGSSARRTVAESCTWMARGDVMAELYDRVAVRSVDRVPARA